MSTVVIHPRRGVTVVGDCWFPGCDKKVQSRGLCNGHYEQERRGKELRPLRSFVPGGAVCHCGKRAKARGLCQEHYDAQRTLEGTRHGTLEQRRARSLRFHYGMTVEQYDALLEEQEGVCAICRSECKSGRHLAVDHDHETRENRGLLCANCNTAVGLMEDNPDLLIAAAKYLNARSWNKGGKRK